jgi:cell division septum initiation protein DivIVA
MSPLTDQADLALRPLRQALFHAAEREAERIRENARREAALIAAEANAEAGRISRDAATRGEADAIADARTNSSQARRTAREKVLTAQESLRLELLGELRTAAVAAQADSRYPALLERLHRRAVAVLGPDAELSESPGGGLIGVAGTRRLDLSLPALALRRAEEMPEEVSGLWKE